MDSEGKPPRARRAKPVSAGELRRLAAQRLLERLQGDTLSAGDLLKVISCEDEGGRGAMPPGDWVLQLLETPTENQTQP